MSGFIGFDPEAVCGKQPCGRRTVAVVDDDASLRRSLGRLLNAYGFLAMEFASAAAFLARYPKAAIDRLALDFIIF
ncbi:hypothetical protein AB9E26_37110, partial [Rhizobium leguminosarum]